MKPFDILKCSWPYPIEKESSAPFWDAALTHLRPQPKWHEVGQYTYWTVDWGEMFRGRVDFRGNMVGFSVVFSIRVNVSGRLSFESPSCVIRQDHQIRRSVDHSGTQVLQVNVGDILEVAVPNVDPWTWAVRLETVGGTGREIVAQYLTAVEKKLDKPSGPPLKIFTHARQPLRTVIALYSMVLNGYVPSRIFIFGDYQWTVEVKELLKSLLPFASFVPLETIASEILAFGTTTLLQAAKTRPNIMKACITLLCQPDEFCMMDDDIFVLGEVQDALDVFQECDLVFQPDCDNSRLYQSIWRAAFGEQDLSLIGKINTGLVWLRVNKDRGKFAVGLEEGVNLCTRETAWAWEQGFIAHCYVTDKWHQLSAQRYLYPLFFGLPGDIEEYDYRNNPCQFATIHFGGSPKPSDAHAVGIAPQLFARLSR